MSQEELDLWRSDQTTLKLRKYFKDYAKSLANQLTSDLVKVEAVEDVNAQSIYNLVVRIQTIEDFLELNAQEVNSFYYVEPEEEKTEKESKKDG